MIVLSATEDHAAQVAAIYAHHVLHGSASFDEVPPPTDFWIQKIKAVTGRGWPFLVAIEDDRVLGYTYATQFRDRAAYRETCENSIYVCPEHLGRGVGSSLLGALIEAATRAGFRQMIAVVGGPEPASIALHARQGFAEVGRLREVGLKFGRRLDTLYMQRTLNWVQSS